MLNFAGQHATSIYKELLDLQSGARVSAIMAPVVNGLSDQDLRDLSAYYAYLPRAAHGANAGTATEIVASGAPMRNVAPCASCHGDIAKKLGAPWLEGQPVTYLGNQLAAFANGTRRNDISEQMRNVARQMTQSEMDVAVRFYARQ